MPVRFDANAKQVIKELNLSAKQTERDINNLLASLTFEIHGEAVKATPIDTGHARQSWHFDIPGFGIMHTDVFNTAHYIRKLEHGWSMQAPKGITIVVMGKIDEIFKRAAKNAGFND